MNRHDLTSERLREVLHYEPETGVFTRRIARGSARAGAIAGTLDRRGYRKIAIDGYDYFGHRLAWLYMTGAWPTNDVDHMFGDHDDNRWSMLRDVTKSANSQNQRKAHSNNISGLLGVHARRNGCFVSTIDVFGKRKYLGYFKTATDAHAAYTKAKRDLHEGCTL